MTKKNNVKLNKIIFKLKKIIETDIKEKKNITTGLSHLLCLTDMELFFYYSYRDDDVENYIIQFSKLIFPNTTKFKPEFTNAVLFDSLSWDYHGVTQQYLRAMMNMNLNILYIFFDNYFERNKRIQQELYNYGHAEILCISTNVIDVQKLILVHKKICDFKPSKIFLHSFSVFDSIIINAIDSSVKLRIDFGDHHCWHGIDFTDYIIGFRDWGMVLCNTIKRVDLEKLIQLPYYPILDETSEFKGFPLYIAGKVLLFSGGALYKIIDEKMTFLRMMHRIVIENENVIILFSCRGDDDILRKYITDNNLSDKIILIGYRKDLSKVFDHIDIYINTYPYGGGLMVQYAMSKGIPILSVTENETIEYLDFTDMGYTYKTEYANIEALHREANRLIKDKEYRFIIGKLIQKYVPSMENFNNLFCDIYNNNFRYTNKHKNKDIKKYNFEENRRIFQDINVKLSISVLSAYLFRVFSVRMFILFPYKIVVRGCIDWLIKKIRAKVKQ